MPKLDKDQTTIQLVIDKKMKDRFRKLAKASGLTLSAWVRLRLSELASGTGANK